MLLGNVDHRLHEGRKGEMHGGFLRLPAQHLQCQHWNCAHAVLLHHRQPRSAWQQLWAETPPALPTTGTRAAGRKQRNFCNPACP